MNCCLTVTFCCKLRIMFHYKFVCHYNRSLGIIKQTMYLNYCSLINSAGKRDRLGLLFPSDKLLVTNRPKAAAEGSGLRPLSYPRNGRGPLPKAAARAPLGFVAP